MPIDFHKIARRHQRRWKTKKVYEGSPNSSMPKFFVTMPYPYVNGLLHIGHTYTSMRCDAFARYKRQRGFNVLFPFAWHATGSPIDTAAKKVAENEPGQIQALKLMGFSDDEIPAFNDPLHWVKTFSREAKKDLEDYGLGVDWRRSFITTDLNPRYSKFIKWQFNTLKRKGFVVKGSHPVVWCPKELVPVGDHSRSEGEGEMPEEMVVIKFRVDGHLLPCATFRPETIFGVTNLWVNPDLEYVEVSVNGEHWMVSRPCIQKLVDQKHVVKELRTILGKDIVGAKVKNPVDGREIPVLPASFVTADTGTGIVMSVPSHAPFDYMALKELQDKNDPVAKSLTPISLVSVDGVSEHFAIEVCKKLGVRNVSDPKLDEATKEVYKKEFHSGKLKEITGKYAGKSIQEAKPIIISDLKNESKAIIFYELSNPVICRCLSKCHVKIVDNQWFLRYGDSAWKAEAMKCLQQLKLYPEKSRSQFEYVVDWLRDWACTREVGLGTPLPWDKKWMIESLSDSTIYNAFYTIVQQLKKVPLGKINDKLFDHVFLGVGTADELGVDKKLLEEMKSEFSYWYPVDFRNSGKDLVQNHLTFYIFNHVAVFPEKFWPRGIGVNGYVTIGQKKMSKSKGIFKTLREVIKAFSADVTRISILATGEELSDVDWDSDLAETLKVKLEQWHDFAIKNFSKNVKDAEFKDIDKWMEHMLHSSIRDATLAMDETLFRTALQRGFFDLQRHLKWYLRRTAGNVNGRLINDIILAQTKVLCSFTPHLCEEIWAKLGQDGFIVNASWPAFDVGKINPALEGSEENMSKVLEDVQQVLKLAKVEKPTLITFFIASDWKVKLCRKVKELLANTRNVGEVMKSVMVDFKDNASDASALVQKFMKDPSKIPSFASHQEAEYQIVLDSVSFLKDAFGCAVEVIKEDGASEPKAKQALPGKPAILVK